MKKSILFLFVLFTLCVYKINSQVIENPVSGTKDYAITGGVGSTYAQPGHIRIYGVNTSGIGGNVFIRSGSGMGTQGSINLEVQSGGATNKGNINLKTDGGRINLQNYAYIPKIYDYDNNSYYLDPSSTGVSLKVAGKIESKEIEVVDLNTKSINSNEIKTANLNVKIDNVADYVFDETYNLRSLAEVEKYVNENKHLPDFPCAKELETNGMNVAEMNNLLLQKIEELTLYIIDLEKRVMEVESK